MLNETRSSSPAPCHSRVKTGKTSDPLQHAHAVGMISFCVLSAKTRFQLLGGSFVLVKCACFSWIKGMF